MKRNDYDYSKPIELTITIRRVLDDYIAVCYNVHVSYDRLLTRFGKTPTEAFTGIIDYIHESIRTDHENTVCPIEPKVSFFTRLELHCGVFIDKCLNRVSYVIIMPYRYNSNYKVLNVKV